MGGSDQYEYWSISGIGCAGRSAGPSRVEANQFKLPAGSQMGAKRSLRSVLACRESPWLLLCPESSHRERESTEKSKLLFNMSDRLMDLCNSRSDCHAAVSFSVSPALKQTVASTSTFGELRKTELFFSFLEMHFSGIFSGIFHRLLNDLWRCRNISSTHGGKFNPSLNPSWKMQNHQTWRWISKNTSLSF